MTEKVWGPGEEYVMGSAFLGLIDYLIRQPGAIEEFERETGMRFKLPSSPIEQMIDSATGAQTEYIRSFICWAQKNYWGEELPPELEEKLKKA